MLTSNKMRVKPSFDWSKTEGLTLLDDLGETLQFHQFTPLSSFSFLEFKNTKDEYLPWFTLADALNPLSSSSDYEEIFQSLAASSSKGFVEQAHVEEFDEKQSGDFRKQIVQTKFEPGDDNAATMKFAELISNPRLKDAVLKFVQGLFVEMYKNGNVPVCVKILTMLGSYSYEELYPFSQAIALASISNKSPRVTSAAINMFAHWGNQEALSLLNNIQEPKEPWIKMKYLSVKKSLEEKCSILER